MRAQVVASWHRSAAAGVHVDVVDAPITLVDTDLRDHREAHLLARVFPLLDDVLGQAARDCDAAMAVFDEAGQLLWRCGSPSVLRRVERIGFVEGSNWDERFAGTNAPGVALALDRPVSIRGAEHFRRSVRGFSCAATPIHDPTSGVVVGALDVTGGEEILVPQTTAMVRAAARMAEAELARDLLVRPGRTGASGAAPLVRLEALGRGEALLTVHRPGGGDGAPTHRLSPRHSEILLLLASSPNGLSGDELMALVHEEDVGASTMRAELNRLRALLGEDLLASRPYRLAADVHGDWLAVEAMLVAGDLSGAVRAYRGPLLPRSVAPGVVQLRHDLGSGLRQTLLRSGDANLMSWWTRADWGRTDREMWRAQERAVGAGTPLAALIRGQIARLDSDFG